MGSKNDVLIRIVEVDDSAPNKGGYYRIRAQWVGDRGETTRWSSCKQKLVNGQSYTGTVTWKPAPGDNKFYYTLSDMESAGGPLREPKRSVPEPSPDKPELPIMDELAALGKMVSTLTEVGVNESTTMNTILMEEFRRGGIERMVEWQKKHWENRQAGNDEPPRDPSPKGSLPKDADIPF